MSYEPTNWKKGDKVTSTRLNKIEQGIQGNDTEISDLKEDLSELTAESGTKDIAVGEIITNSYVDTDGTIKAYNGWNRTDYIDISRYESITANIATTYAAYYGASKEFVGQANITANTEMPVPANAKYIMISQASGIMSNLMLKGSCSDGIVTKIRDALKPISEQFYTFVNFEQESGSISDGGLNISENPQYVRVKSPSLIGDLKKIVLLDPTTYILKVFLYTGTSQYSFTRMFRDVTDWNASVAEENELYIRYEISQRASTKVNLDPTAEYVKTYGPTLNINASLAEKVNIAQGTENVGKVLAVNASGLVEPSDIQIDVDPTLSVQGDAADAKATGDRISAVELSGLNAFDSINFVIGDISNNIGIMNSDSTNTNACSSGYFKVSDYAGVVLKADSTLYRLDLYFYTSTRWQDFVKANNQIDVSRYMFTDSEAELYFRVQIRSRNSAMLSTSIRYADLLTSRDGVTVEQRNTDKRNAIVTAKGKNQNNFSLLVLTDIHGDGVRMLNAIDFLNKCDKIDAGACLGDISANHYATNCDFYPNAVLNAEKDFFTVIGNHDAGNGTAVSTNGTQQQIFDKFIAPVVAKTGTETTTSYYYKDYDTPKVRVIVLNSSDMPDTLANETTFAVSHGTLGAFSQAQINWFISTLANTPTGYHVLILMHYVNAPMHSDSDVNFQSSSGGYASGRENNAYSGIIQDIVSAWVSGGTLTQSYTSSVANMPTVNVSADFTSRGTGVFIGVLSGHMHRDIIGKFDNYPNQLACVFSLANQPRGSEDDLARIAGEKSEDLLTVVSVDTTNRRLYLVRIGANLSTLFKYREDSCIEY